MPEMDNNPQPASSLSETVLSVSSKINPKQRRHVVAALVAQGFSNTEIAEQLGTSTKTIQRDKEEIKPAAEVAETVIARAKIEIQKLMPVEQRVEKLVAHARDAKNEAVSLAALNRLDDLDGIVTEKELVRSKSTAQPDPAPMFMLPPGAQVNVTVNQVSVTSEKCINMQVEGDNARETE